MTPRRVLLCFTGLCAGLAALSCAPSSGSAVRVWEATRTIPTYEEGPPDPNPPFDLFASTRFNYPYTMRTSLTDKREPRTWRTLHLENEYLAVTVLPDLGGHLLQRRRQGDRAGDVLREPVDQVRPGRVPRRVGAFGVEFNFPVSHNWVTMSPVDFATRVEPGRQRVDLGGHIDRVVRHAVAGRADRCGPGAALLEQRTTLYNRSDVRHRFYWWTNAAVEVWDDSQHPLPAWTFTACHGFADVDTWPVNAAGVDLSGPGNHRYGPCLAVRPRQPRAVHGRLPSARPAPGSCTTRRPSDLPAKKIWSWGMRRRRPRLAPGALRQQQRVRRDPGRALPQPGDVRVPRAAGDDAGSPSTGCRCARSAASRAPRPRRS